ncbi:hypothetical protein M426DRAFT_261436 [Hypoxylon sp. CI-4A]|nr:hypothetical protein M426DRAFT_261436 [Hypoxylon sp. CI-4A]
MATPIDLVVSPKNDVEERLVPVPGGCACGAYKYYSQKCKHMYKMVYFKCGETTSAETGRTILCDSGRSRYVEVTTALVPFNCKKCRNSNHRWAPPKDGEQNGQGSQSGQTQQ